MLEGWKKEDESLVLDVTVSDFLEAVEYVNQVAKVAEDMDHHPDVLIHDYNQVRITARTHSAGKVTDKDYELAEAINKLTAQYV